MLTWKNNKNGFLEGDCLSKDVPQLPIDGKYVKNGTEVYVMDEPDGINATSNFYKFDEENSIWIPQ